MIKDKFRKFYIISFESSKILGECRLNDKNDSIFEILGTIDRFFDPTYIFQTVSKDPIEYGEYKTKQQKKYPKLEERIEKIILESNVFESVKRFKTIPTSKFVSPILKYTAKLFNDKEYQDYCLDNLQFLAEHQDYWVKKKPFFDDLLYFKIEPILSQAVNISPDGIRVLEIYRTLIEDSEPIDSILKSIGFILEERKIIEKMFFESSMSELMNYHNWMFFNKLKESEDGEFEIYFNDWALKSSQIIESYIKSIFTLILMLKMFKNNTTVEDIKLILPEYDSIGRILSFLDPNYEFKNLSLLRIYRNASFHNGVRIRYTKDKRIMVFKDKSGQTTESLDQFINNFVKILMFISTINYMVAQIGIKYENNGKSLFELNYEFAKEHGMIAFWNQASKDKKNPKKL